MSPTRSLVRFLGTSVVVAMLAASIAEAQQATQAAASTRGIVSGIVRDGQSRLPLDAVTVRIVGTSLGATTAGDGRYSITGVGADVVTLEAMRVGYALARVENVHVVAGQTTASDITMTAQTLHLDNVITAGVSDPTSGTNTPFDVTKLSAPDMPVPNLGSAAGILKGKVAGLRVVNGGGPLAGSNVQLRNMVTLQTYPFAVSPMYIVDGVILLNTFSGFTSEIEPQDIESIEVIKGAAAAALYGTKAANGVISIRTNRGQGVPQGQTRFGARAEYGYSDLNQIPALATHHFYLMDDAGHFVDQFGTPLPAGQRVIDPDRMMDNAWTGTTYDHLKQVFKGGTTTLARGNVGYNTLSTNFSAQVAGTHETGVLRNSKGGEKVDFRLNVDHRVSDRINFSLGTFVNHQYADDRFSTPAAPDTGLFRNVIRTPPTVDLLAPGTNGLPYVLNPDPFNPAMRHPLYNELVNDRWSKRLGLQANADGTFRITPELSLGGLLGYQRSDRLSDQYISPGTVLSPTFSSEGTISHATNLDEGLNGDVRLSYLSAFDRLTVRASARVAATYDERRSVGVFGDTLDLPDNRSLARAKLITANGLTGLALFRKSRDEIGTVAADYDGRYIAEAVYRRDGSSLFGAHARYQSNNRVSAAWKMSSESWWPVPALSLFKLRYSRGTAGNPPPFTAQYETYSTAGIRLTKTQSGNEDLQSERVTENEFGLDMAMGTRFGLELTYAKQFTRDLLDTNDILAFTGFRKRVDNVGTLRGRSYEATFEAHWYNTPNFRWSTSLVADRERARVLSYQRSGPCSTSITYDNWRCAGVEIGSMQGPKFVVQPNELLPRVAANQVDQFQVNDEGLVVWVGPNGNWQDGRWGTTGFVKTPAGDSTQYRWGLPILKRDSLGVAVTERYGQALPKFSFGMQNTWTWKSWQGYVSLVGQYGSHVYDLARATYMGINLAAEQDQSGKPSYEKKPLEYYTQANSTTIGGRGKNDNGISASPTFWEPNSFIKLDEMSVSYLFRGLPGPLTRLDVRSGTIGLVGRQVYTWTKYQGFDPEVGGDNGGGGTSVGIDGLAYPRYRTFTLQVGLNF